MRTWTVEGAEVATGISRTVRVMAQDENEAARIVRQQGLLAGSIYVFDPSAKDNRMEELSAAANKATPRTRGLSSPRRSSVNETRRRLNAADFVLSLMGWVYITISLVGSIVVIALAIRNPHVDPMAVVPQTIIFAICGVSFGILLLGAGAAFRMLGMIGLATTKTANKE